MGSLSRLKVLSSLRERQAIFIREEVLLLSWAEDLCAVLRRPEPMAREVPRVRMEMRGRRVVRQAEITPMQGSAADQMAESV